MKRGEESIALMWFAHEMQGLAFGDVDNDGKLDMFITAIADHKNMYVLGAGKPFLGIRNRHLICCLAAPDVTACSSTTEGDHSETRQPCVGSRKADGAGVPPSGIMTTTARATLCVPRVSPCLIEVLFAASQSFPSFH